MVRAMTLSLDYSLALDSGSNCGLKLTRLRELDNDFQIALNAVLDDVNKGTLGFWNLPREQDVLARVEKYVATVDPKITDVVVLGIGGSSLGGRALYEALGGPPELRTGRRLHFPDNSDPWRLAHLLEALDPQRTLAIAISKSGGTVETAATLLIVRKWLREAKAASNLVLITDPERGSLRKLAADEGLHTEVIPPNVGGRFSVLTPVGLLPAGLVGFDLKGLLRGADAMRERCESTTLTENPAGILAALCVLHHQDHGRHIHILMPYADALRGLAAWFVQLWAESLGKRHALDGSKVETGPTPLPAVGATDQHAQVQLFMEGPRDKLLAFVAVDDVAQDLTIPGEPGPNAYLEGHTLGELLHAERRGTAEALAADGRPSLTLSVPRLDAAALGELFFVWQAATAIAGRLYKIDAFDQPGVELGKKLAFGLLGREGFESERKQVLDAEAGRAKHVC